MPSVATLFGSDLVTGALRNTLNQVQKNCSFLNPKQLSKKERRKEKKLRKKLQRRYGFLGKQVQHPRRNESESTDREALLSSSAVQEETPELKSDSEECSSGSSDLGDSDNWFTSSPLDFVTDGPQVSAFTLSIRQKYTCLNTMNIGPGNAQPEQSPANSQSQSLSSSASSLTFGTVEEAPTSPISNNASKVLIRTEKSSPPESNGHAIKSSSSIEFKKEIRAENEKESKTKILDLPKATTTTSSSNGQLPKKLIQSNLTGFLARPAAAVGAGPPKGKPNGTKVDDKSAVVRLPEPKVVLYERGRIKPGWRMKFSVGAGFINLGNTCYMNATLQALLHTPAFVNWLVDEIHDKEHKRKCERNTQLLHQCTICPLTGVASGAFHNQQAIRPIQIHNKLKTIGKNFSFGRQEDAHEFLRLLLESMERSYLSAVGGHRLDNRSKETTPLGQIFGGYTRGEVRCLTCRHVSTTFHPHAELQLDIREVNNVEDALAFYFQKERLDNNDYKCERCKTVQPATKQQFMELAPIVLCIQLKRFRACGSKIKKPIFINERLNLRRFMFNQSDDRCQAAEYKLVGLVTHMGPSPNCGHYTAIAQAANGNYYQFDDSYVRPTSLNHAQNADAYVIIYETTERKRLESSLSSPSPLRANPPPSSSLTSSSSSTSSSASAATSSNNTSPNFIGPQLPPGRIPEATTAYAKAQKQSPEHQSLPQNKPFSSPVGAPPKSAILVKSPSTNSPIVKKSINGLAGVRKFTISGNSPLGPSAKLFQQPGPTRFPYPSNNNNSSGNTKERSSANRFLTSSSLQKGQAGKRSGPLVPYGDDSDEEDSTPRNGTMSTAEKPGNDSPRASSQDPRRVYRPPSPPKIRAWSDEESKLGKSMELERKRPWVRTKEEIEDEEIDAGKVKKKAKSHSPEPKHKLSLQQQLGMNPFDKHL